MSRLPDYRCTWPKCDCIAQGPTCKMADLAKDEERQAERDAAEACADLDE
jgi:hypothetical protein